MVQDQRGERDVLRYSGGELKLILILFRIAVAIWSGEIHNSTFYMLAMDETFDSLGAEGAEDLLRVLDYLSDRISFLIVVTHDPALADLFRSQIRMKQTPGGIEIKLIGAKADAM